MADELRADIVFDPIFGAQARKKVIADSTKTGNTSGKKFSKKFNNKLSSNLGKGISKILKKRITLPSLGVASAFAGVATAAAAAFGSRAIINAAKVQEDAINSLNTSLKLSGQFTKQASQDFQEYASALQQQTKFGDEAILQNAALLQSLGRLSTDGLKEATTASVDLAAALGVSLESAVTLVGKAAVGEVGSFSRYGLVIKKGANNAETFRKVLDKLKDQFGGAAAAQLATFSGATQSASNAFGDLQEELGFAITKNATVISGVAALKKGFESLSKFVIENQDAIKTLVSQGFVGLVNSVSLVVRGVLFAAEAFVTMKGAISDLGNTAILSDLNNQLQEAERLAVESADSVVRAKARAEADNLKIAIDATNAQVTEERNQSQQKIAVLEEFQEEVKRIGNEIVNAKPIVTPDVVVPPPDGGGEETKLDPIDQEALDSLTLFGLKLKSVDAGAKQFALNWKKIGAQVKNTAVNGIGKGVAQGFAAVGASLVNGENALKAFGKAFAAAIGQTAVQLGQRFILEGIALSFSPLAGPAVGGPMIAAGAALSIFGGALGAAAGGGGGGGAAAGGGGAGFSAQDVGESPLTEQVEEREEPETKNTIVVNGDIFDSDDSGRRLLEIINSESLNNGGVITNGAFA